MYSPLAKWNMSGGQLQLYCENQNLQAIFKGKETIPLEVSNAPKITDTAAKKLASLQNIYYPTLSHDRQGKVTRVDFNVRGAGGGFWKWLCPCCFSEEKGLQQPLLSRSPPVPAKEEKALASKDLPKNVVELVNAYQASNISQERRKVLLQIAGGMVDQFSRMAAPSANAIRECALLTQIPHRELTSRILETLIRLIRDQVTLSMPLIQGFALALEHAHFECLNSDDLVQILHVFANRLHKTHENDEQKIALELQAMARILNAMEDIDLKGLHRIKTHDPIYQILDQFSSSKCLNLAIWATYAKQALIRVPNGETVVRLFFRKCKHLGMGIFNLVGLARTHRASLLLDAFQEFRQLCHRQDAKEEWYDRLRACEWLFLLGETDLLRQELCQSKMAKHPFFVWGLVSLCDRMIQTSPSISIRKTALGILVEIFQNKEGHWTLESRTWEKWVHGRNYSQALKEHLASLFLSYPQLPKLHPEAIKAKELVEEPVPIHNLIWLEEEDALAPSSLLQAAKKSYLPIEIKLEAIRKNLLGDEVFREMAAFYVPVLGIQSATKLFDLKEMTLKFSSSSQKVMLILGNAGSGKSFFSETMAVYLWNQYEPDGEIPVYISLALLKDPVRNAIPEFFSSFGFSSEEIEEIRQTRELIIFLDGFDEINQLHNLYATNQLHKWNCHVIITCRTQHLTSVPDYLPYFVPSSRGSPQNHLFLETTIAPFSPEQRKQFLQMYVPKAETPWGDWEQYEKEIERIPGLAGLLQNPFLLKVAGDVLPEIVIKHQAENPDQELRITQTDLFDAFIWHWFERQKNKIVESGQEVNSRTLMGDFEQFCKTLAKKMTDKGLTVVTYREKSNLFPSSETDEWEPFFGNSNPRTVTARTGAPLRKFGPNQWGFLHDTLRAYFASKQIYSA